MEIDYSCLHATSWLLSSSPTITSSLTSESSSIFQIISSQRHENIWNLTSEILPSHSSSTSSTKRIFSSQYTLLPSKEINTGCFPPKDSIGQLINGENLVSFLEISSNIKEDEHNPWNPIRRHDMNDNCNRFVNSKNQHYDLAIYPRCLADQLHDDGKTHSQIFGWSRDSYPIYGPYQNTEILAKSSWRLRDYTTMNSSTGCKSQINQRSCYLIDPLHPEKGIIELPPHKYGPSFDKYPLGFFYEDYYFDNSYRINQEYLDEHNGHEHEPYGYHYHFTINKFQEPIFPFIIGPKYYGCLSQISAQCCQSIDEILTDSCPISSKYSICDSNTRASIKYQCSDSSFDIPPSDIFSSQQSRKLQINTPSWTQSPTQSPTAFQSPTFKPTISFISQSPTFLTDSPTLQPTTTKQLSQQKGDTKHQLTSNDITLIILIVIGGFVVLGSVGTLIYWHMYTRTGPAYSHPATTTSPTYIERIKDLTGISLVEK